MNNTRDFRCFCNNGIERSLCDIAVCYQRMDRGNLINEHVMHYGLRVKSSAHAQLFGYNYSECTCTSNFLQKAKILKL